MRCKSPLMAVTLLVACSALPSLPAAQVFLLDLGGGSITGTGPSPDDPVNTWNNIPTSVTLTDAGQSAGLVTIENSATLVTLQMTSRFNGVNENGTLESTIFPGNATRDSLFGNTAVFGELSNVFPAFRLTNLDATNLYSFTFYASRTAVGDNRETQYDIAGATQTVAFLNASNNIDTVATSVGILPDASNAITISITPGPNNTNANTQFTYLGVLRIDAAPIPEPATGVLALAGLLLIVRRRAR